MSHKMHPVFKKLNVVFKKLVYKKLVLRWPNQNFNNLYVVLYLRAIKKFSKVKSTDTIANISSTFTLE